MKNNPYAGWLLLREIEGINIFFSLVLGKKLDSIEFTSRGKKKNDEKYYLVCKFENEFYNEDSASSNDLQFIQELEKKEESVIKDVYAAAKKWLDKHCQIENVSIKIVENITKNDHLCFSNSKVSLQTDMPYENPGLNNLFHYKKRSNDKLINYLDFF